MKEIVNNRETTVSVYDKFDSHLIACVGPTSGVNLLITVGDQKWQWVQLNAKSADLVMYDITDLQQELQEVMAGTSRVFMFDNAVEMYNWIATHV